MVSNSFAAAMRRCFLLAGCTAGFSMAASGGEVFTLKWQESGLTAKTGGMRPLIIELSETSPAGLKKAPANLVAPHYGSFTLGPDGAAQTYIFIVDETNGNPARLLSLIHI